jgi:putative peptidoglycan lipid II flippase
VAPIVYNLSILASALWLAPALGPNSRQRVYGLAAGVAVGGFLHFAAQLPSFFGLHLGWRPTFDWRSSGVQQVAKLMLPISIGLAATQVNLSVDQLLASMLPHGRVSALAFATSLMQIPIGTVAAAVGIVAFPHFARLAASGDHPLLRRTVASVIRLLLFAMLPATVGLVVLRVPLVQVVYQRGAFTADSTAQTAFALLFLSLGVSAHSAIPLMSRVFYSFHDTRTPLRIALAGMLLNLLLSISLVRPLQQGGLGLATSLTAAFSLVLLLRSMTRHLPGFPTPALWRATVRMALAAVLMGVVVAALLQLSQGPLAGAGFLARALWLVALAGCGALVYLAAAWVLRLPELPVAWAAAHGRVELLPEGV